MGTVAGVRRPTVRAQKLRREATPAERRLWTALSASKLGYKFSRQMPIGDYVCDFVFRSARLAIELDGYSYNGAIARDERRDRFLASRGVRTLRFANAEVMTNLKGVVVEIERALAALPTPAPSRKREGSW